MARALRVGDLRRAGEDPMNWIKAVLTALGGVTALALIVVGNLTWGTYAQHLYGVDTPTTYVVGLGPLLALMVALLAWVLHKVG